MDKVRADLRAAVTYKFMMFQSPWIRFALDHQYMPDELVGFQSPWIRFAQVVPLVGAKC